jgi:aerobic-type carbon monoxide dehydrogenase small subunit (CoxS/CutS family)
MEAAISFTVNGHEKSVTTDPQRPLLDVLREDLQLTGTKYGCGEGKCGSCTVLVDDKCVEACTTPIAKVAGKAVLTIEGLAGHPARQLAVLGPDALHPVQEAFLAEEAFQCGFCTPAMILTTVALLKEAPNPTDEQVLAALDKNLCRCCGYTKILKAVRRAAGPPPAAGHPPRVRTGPPAGR